ncbi:hypothetical protein FALCPG4_005085 [Fusarium falciforme]
MSLEHSETSSAGPQSPSITDDSQIRSLSIDILDGDHHDLFTRAITRILSTEVAELTYAQIIDGLPLTRVIYESRGGKLPKGHPLHSAHQELCRGMLDKVRQFREEFAPEILSIDSRLLFAYQAAAPGSRAFNIRLIELMAVAVHQIAVMLFNLGTSLHKDDGITEWAPPKANRLYWDHNPDGPLPTLFKHPWYVDYDQYPNGVADMAGYWAESRILGGVVVFDRRRQSPDFDPYAVYLHPNRTNVTYRIFELLPEQKQALIEFLTADAAPTESPLPILGHDMNRNRVDPEEPIEETGIYRDLWERKELPLDAPDAARMRDVWDVLDFPTQADKAASKRRAIERRDRYLLGDDGDV